MAEPAKKPRDFSQLGPQETRDFSHLGPGGGAQPTTTTPTDDRGWMDKTASALVDWGVGGAKELGTMATYPSRLLTSLGVPGYKDQNYDYLEPTNWHQQFGGNVTKGLAYIAPGKKEAAAAEGLNYLLKEGLPNAPRFITGALNTLGRGAIAGSTAAATANVVGDDPVSSGNTAAVVTSGVIPALTGLAKLPGVIPGFRYLPSLLRRSGQESYSRAMGGPPSDVSTKYYLENQIDPLIKKGRIITSARKAMEEFRAAANAALSKKQTARESMPEDLSIAAQEILDMAERAKAQFRNVKGAGGSVMANSDADIEAMRQIDNLILQIRKTRLPADLPQEMLDAPAEQLLGQGVLPSLREGDQIAFDALDSLKRQWAGNAAEHGAYQGANPTLKPVVGSQKSMADQSRLLLEEKAVPEWTAANKEFSINTSNADQMESAFRSKSLGKNPAPSETIFGGFGAGFEKGAGGVATGAPIRALRKVEHSPLWNSLMGVGKDRLAGLMEAPIPQNFTMGNIGAYASPETQKLMELQPGEIEDGYLYIGGDKKDPNSWQKVE